MNGLSIDAVVAGGAGPYTLKIPRGACVGLCGASGAGKTRLLRAVADLEPCSGDIALNGVTAASVPGPEWRSRVALLPADARWWHPTAREHFPNPDAIDPTPLGLEVDLLDQPVTRLSAGQRQRLALLRLLAREPRCLLLDEPTSHLDPDSAGLVEKLVARYRKERDVPVLWVGHDPAQLARVAERLLSLTPRGVFDL
ncbi:MAG: ATP-binding cassette domain-containing protein [Nitrospirota bacterium]|nr:ATP-binding cassette domain-containing protein [Nitrospirota bacterium]